MSIASSSKSSCPTCGPDDDYSDDFENDSMIENSQ